MQNYKYVKKKKEEKNVEKKNLKTKKFKLFYPKTPPGNP